MREFLSQNEVVFEERNVAQEPRWRAELQRLQGEVLVPVLVVDGERVVGFDEKRIASLLGLDTGATGPETEGLHRPAVLDALPSEASASFLGDIEHLTLRIQQEMEFNARKGSSDYRRGQHDGMRFARDALVRILDGEYKHERLVIERESDREP